ncbi:MAG: hypothetical protein CVU95_13525 [Firmicutes bacterium HGW-Firmicutes-2]|jgi:hypothetical protein|nr:MAG: hypothetical protein CVU95_13525 [Firmicutes bacterium HGW-Firmicutes-2]
MVFKNDKPKLGIIKFVIISIVMIFILCILGYYVLGSIGIIYIKNGEGEKVYYFIEDMDADGTRENVKFVNHYCSYYRKNITDSYYTSNFIKIYLDDKEIYSNKICTLSPLTNPQIVDFSENNILKKQIYVHDRGGGPAIPMDYFFSIKHDKVELISKTVGH